LTLSDIPKFSSGQIGKLDAKAVNKIASTVNRSSSPEELASPTSKYMGGLAQFPIVAMLGKRVDPEEEEVEEGGSNYFGGYEWAEVKYDITTGKWPAEVSYQNDLRKYTDKGRNAAYGLGLTTGTGSFTNPYGLSEYLPDYAGKIVHLFPTRSSTGVPMLAFQPPAEPTTYVAQIIGYESDSKQCEIVNTGGESIPNLHLYLIRVGTVRGFDAAGGGSFVFEEEQFEGAEQTIGVNLIELNGETHLGGSIINGENSCEGGTNLSRAPLPIGTYVTATRMFRTSSASSDNLGHDSFYAFAVTNELCVGCCGAETNASPLARKTVVHPRHLNNISRIERYQGNILREMTK